VPPKERDASRPRDAEKNGLASTKTSVGAMAIGLLDSSGRLLASSEGSADTFWSAFDDLGCLPRWKTELVRSGYAHMECLCGLHTVRAAKNGHRGWFMVVLQGKTPEWAKRQRNIEPFLESFREDMPSATIWGSPPTGGGSGGGNQGPAELGIPVSWARGRKPN
jgi:hypothetical protein